MGGGWRAFTWGAGAPVLTPDGPFTFSHPSPVVVTVVDVACVGDEFRLSEQGVTVGFSSNVVPDPECNDPDPTLDPVVALDRGEYSRAVFQLPAGAHALNVQVTTNMPGTRTAHIRVDAGACGSGPAVARSGAVHTANLGKLGRADRQAPLATALTVGGGWTPFLWGAGVPACAEDGPYTFSFSDSVKVTVVDTSCRGDRFRLAEGTAVLGYTSLVPMGFCPDPGDTEDPDVALAGGAYSAGAFTLPAGAHALSIQAIANPHGAGAGYVRVDAAPANPCTFGTATNIPAVAIPVNGGWSSFTWGSGAPACSASGPFTFAGAGTLDVKVTTIGCRGAALKVYNQTGALVQTTSTVPVAPCPAPGDTTTADVAFADPAYSHAAFTLPAGPHQLSIEATPNPLGGGGGFIRVDGLAGVPGGKNLKITTGAPDLTWDTGTAQVAYYILRAPISPSGPIVLLGPEAPAVTSFDDATVPPGTFNCYIVAPVDSVGLLGLSDLLCAQSGFAGGSAMPGGFTLGLNQTATATLSWTAPAGGADGYTLLVIPLNGAAVTTVALAGSATSSAQATGGSPACYVLFAVQGAASGNTNMLCGFPGVATLSSARARIASLQAAVDELSGGLQGLDASSLVHGRALPIE